LLKPVDGGDFDELRTGDIAVDATAQAERLVAQGEATCLRQTLERWRTPMPAVEYTGVGISDLLEE
jgi:hypothetical protein